MLNYSLTTHLTECHGTVLSDTTRTLDHNVPSNKIAVVKYLKGQKYHSSTIILHYIILLHLSSPSFKTGGQNVENRTEHLHSHGCHAKTRIKLFQLWVRHLTYTKQVNTKLFLYVNCNVWFFKINIFQLYFKHFYISLNVNTFFSYYVNGHHVF